MNSVITGLKGRRAAILGRGHVAETRLNAIAEAGAVASSAEMAHLQACRRCRSLLVGFGRTAGVLGGAWADRALNRGVEIPAGTAHVRLGLAGGFGRPAARGVRRRAAVPVGLVAILVALVATAGLLALRGGGLAPAASGPRGSTAGATPYGTPQTTGLVARLPLDGLVSWAPDSEHLLVVVGNAERHLRPFWQPRLTPSGSSKAGWTRPT